MAKKPLTFNKPQIANPPSIESKEDSSESFIEDYNDKIPEETEDDFTTYNDGSLSSDTGILDTLLNSSSGEDEQSIWMKQLLTDENLLIKTDVPEKAIPALAKAIVLAKKYKSQRLFDYILYYLRLRISRNREGRKEIVAMALRTKGRDELDEF